MSTNTGKKLEPEIDNAEDENNTIDNKCYSGENMIEQETEIIDIDNSVNDELEDNANKTFVNPSQGQSETMFKCENCDFEAARKSDVMKH